MTGVYSGLSVWIVERQLQHFPTCAVWRLAPCNKKLELTDVTSDASAWMWLQQLLIKTYFQTIFPSDISIKRMHILRSEHKSVVKCGSFV